MSCFSRVSKLVILKLVLILMLIKEGMGIYSFCKVVKIPYFCIMKKMIFIVLIALFLKPILPVIDYVVNYEYISKVLCENKDKPKLQCNGKCHLMKELAKAAETENPKSSDKKENTSVQEVLFFKEMNSFSIVFFGFQPKTKINSSYLNLYSYLNEHSEFHPPTFIS